MSVYVGEVKCNSPFRKSFYKYFSVLNDEINWKDTTIICLFWGALSVTFTFVRNEIGESSSNPGRGWLRFTLR